MNSEEELTSLFKYLRLPDFATILNALFGVAAIFLILLDRDNALQASIFILLGVMMDGLDGLIARKVQYGILGANLDSLADLITFGLAPAAICYVQLTTTASAIFSAIFLIFGMLRLARFNVLSGGDSFTGLPITAAGAFIALFMLAYSASGFFKALIIPLLAILSLLMVSRTPHPKIRDRKVLVIAGSIFTFTVAGFFLDIKVGDQNQLYIWGSRVLLVLLSFYILIPIARRILNQYEKR